MEKHKNNAIENYTIDIAHIVRCLLKRMWIIVLSAFLSGSLTFLFFSFLVAPEYSSSVMLYVNNGSFLSGNAEFTISPSEITAAQSLVKTYGEILDSRTTLQRVIEKSEVDYDYETLSDMVESSLSNNTEIMKVTVTSEDPYEAAKIANCIAEVLPERIAEIIDGASMEIVDEAVADEKKVYPKVLRNTVAGALSGAAVAVAILVLLAVFDGAIHNEDYIVSTYNYPVLARIPNLSGINSKQNDYYGYGNYKPKK